MNPVDVLNVLGDACDEERTQPGYRGRRLRATRRLGASLLGASVYEVPPGESTWPFHLHWANEELLLVLEGTPTLRTSEGDRVLAPGDMTLFARGSSGGHKLTNRGDQPARVLVVSTMVEPDIVEYTDSGKLGLFAGAAPGAPEPEGERGMERFVRAEDAPYYDEEGG